MLPLQRSAVFTTISTAAATHFSSPAPHPVHCSRRRCRLVESLRNSQSTRRTVNYLSNQKSNRGRTGASRRCTQSVALAGFGDLTGFWEMKLDTALKNGYQLLGYRFTFRHWDISFAFWRHVVLSWKLIYLYRMSNKRQVANFFSFSQDWKCPARIDRNQSCENRTIFSYAIDALNQLQFCGILTEIYKYIKIL